MPDELKLESPYSPGGFHSAEWSTPPTVFAALDKEFSFTVDVAADPANAKCDRFYSVTGENPALGMDGLGQSWASETVWCNPPYGRGQIERWTRTLYASSVEEKTTSVLLLPSDTGTAWFHDYCLKGEVRFLRGRLRFGGTSGSPTFASIVVVFRAVVSC